jgi:hypothetical protein
VWKLNLIIMLDLFAVKSEIFNLQWQYVSGLCRIDPMIISLGVV